MKAPGSGAPFPLRFSAPPLGEFSHFGVEFGMYTIVRKWIEPNMQLPAAHKRFSNADIRKLIVPLFFEQLLVMLVGIADTFMVSYAGDAAVSGVSLVNMFNTVFIYLFTALASGGAVVVSQYLGRREQSSADLSGSQLLVCSILLSAVLTAVSLIWNRQLLGLLFGRVEPDVMESCVTYLCISAYSFPAIAVYNAGAAICRSMNQTRVTLYVSAASNVLNVVGNAIGIFVLHAGVAGVAYPSLVARVFSAVAVTAFCFGKDRAVRYRTADLFRLDTRMVWRILRVAVPGGVENGLFQLIKVALSSITAMFGTAQIAANGVAQSFWSLAALVGAAMGPAFVTIIGQCMGAGDSLAATYYMRKLMRITLLISVLWNVLVFAFTPVFLRFYPLDRTVTDLILALVLIHNVCNAVLYPFSGVMPNGMRAAGDVRYAMLVSVFSTAACRLVLSVVFGVWMQLGVIGVALAMCCDWAVRTVFTLLRYKSGKWKTFHVI